ncbi:MAG TPA: 23S rRNA (adenine(2030)-N(6))-methyltransferase RlmJ [Acetobacteraceae bacterium]|nr:23S rRNA (adenine(2030)-N(6))-methyltransferase RlmJ [Acetobacteraceae bacterium]
MNYRHAYHAGNFADCLKQALALWLLTALQRKPRPITVLDTHAGAGGYDLSASEAARTGEWRTGIGRLMEDPPVPLAAYVALVRASGCFPGTALLARSILRPNDRLICCELHPDEYAALRRRFAHDSQVAIHHRDGYEALRALLPPDPRRGLVLIDPPYEQPGEFGRVLAGLSAAHVRFREGVLAAWYPIKHRAPVRAFHASLRESGMRDIVAAELFLREPTDPARLNGAGMVVINPPFEFEPAARTILDALAERLATDEPGGGAALVRLVDE